jgi:hypothetical protein
MALATIHIERSKCVTIIWNRLIVVLVIVMPQVLGLSANLVPAIRSHGRPAELEWQQDQHEDGDASTHRETLPVASLQVERRT